MINKIMRVSCQKMKNIREEIQKREDIFLVEIKGEQCTTLSEYLDVMSDSLQFPIRAKGLDGYLDWMTDLTWIEKPEVIIVIYEFKDFLENDLQIKEAIIEDFKGIILPWWESEVVNYVVEGETRKITLYLVD